MPKMKTHSGASKRFRLTGTGKIMRQKANRRHNFEHKPTTRTRRLAGRTEVSSADRKRIKSLLGQVDHDTSGRRARLSKEFQWHA